MTDNKKQQESIMTKLQTWNEAQNILKELGLFSNKEVVSKFEQLLAPKKSGGTSIKPIEHDGELYHYCRFTGLYQPEEQMVFQNDEKRSEGKHKGYSKIGMSLWTKGQAYLKNLKMKSVEIAYGEDQSDEAREEGMKLHREAVELEKNNSMNDHVYLMEHFLTDEQADVLESLELPEA